MVTSIVSYSLFASLTIDCNLETFQVILQTKANTFIQKLLKMQAVTDDEDLAYQE